MLKIIKIFLLITLLSSCVKDNKPFTKTYTTQDGMSISFTIYDKRKIDSTFFNKPLEILKNLSSDLSIWQQSLDKPYLRELKRGQVIELSLDYANVLREALFYAREFNGIYDPSLGLLTKLWSKYMKKREIPNPGEIKEALENSGWNKVTLEGNFLTSSSNGILIDLGSAYKGYIVDKISQYFSHIGVKKAIISYSFSSLYLISNDERTFKVGIIDPKTQANFPLIVKASNIGVSTTGVYQNYIIKDNKRYHHIFNSQTGYPFENDILSITVLHPSALKADILSTALFGLGRERALNWAFENKVQVIIISNDNSVYLSPAINKNNVEINNLEYKLID